MNALYITEEEIQDIITELEAENRETIKKFILIILNYLEDYGTSSVQPCVVNKCQLEPQGLFTFETDKYRIAVSYNIFKVALEDQDEITLEQLFNELKFLEDKFSKVQGCLLANDLILEFNINPFNNDVTGYVLISIKDPRCKN